jgi:hypothetical protein
VNRTEDHLQLPEVITSRLRQFGVRRQRTAISRGLAEAVIGIAGVLFLVILIEAILQPRSTGRFALSVCLYLAALGFVGWRVVLPLLRRTTPLETARAFEKAAGAHFRERIVSAVELARTSGKLEETGVSAWMASRTIQLAAEEIGVIDPGILVDSSVATSRWKLAGGLLSTIALLCLVPGIPERLWLALYPRASAASLSRIRLAVVPGNCRLPQRTPLEIHASANAPVEQATVAIKWNDGFQETATMSRGESNTFKLSLPALSQGFRYSVQAERAESDFYTVAVDVPPRVSQMRLQIRPPAYTGWTNRMIEGGTADFLVGSQVRLAIETTAEKVATADFLPEGAAVRAMTPDKTGYTLEMQPTNIVTYQIRLVGENGLTSESSQRWTLRPMLDLPPTSRITALGAEPGLIQRDEVLALEMAAADDVGLRSVTLIVLNKEAESDLKPIQNAFSRTAPKEVRSAVNYNLADLGPVPGDELHFQLVATDLQGQTTRSEPLVFTVGSKDKTAEARLAARLKELVGKMQAQADFMQQTKASWLSIARNYREEDSNPQRPALALLQSRLRDFSRSVASIGGELIGESETNGLAEARFMYRLGTTLAAWGDQQAEVLVGTSIRLGTAKGSGITEVFDQGRDLFGRALTGLEQYRRVVSVLQGMYETDVLAARCESAQARYKRGLSVLRGNANAIAPMAANASGLRAVFYEGLNCDGKVLEQKVDRPTFDNYAPGGRSENWSCRYEGDLEIRESGDWTLACMADDGVRLLVDGKSILPANAWSAHAATEYKTDVNLPSGWHPVTVEFFQGSSQSRLRFLAGRKGQPLQEVPLDWLRPPSARKREPSPVTKDPALNAVVQDALRERVKVSLATVSSAPPLVAPLTNDVSNESLLRLVREKLPTGNALSTNLVRFASWNAEDAQKAEAQGDELAQFAKDAQRILKEELEKYRWRYEGAAALKEVQNAIQELREIQDEFRRLPWHNPSKPTEAEKSKLSLARAWEEQLDRATQKAARNFFETAKQKDATLAERVAAFQAANLALTELQPSVDNLEKTLREEKPKDAMAAAVDQRLNEVTEKYRRLNELQEKMNQEQVAAEARKALPAARAFERAQQANSDSMREKYGQLKSALANIEQAQRVVGDYQGAQRLEELASNSPQSAKGKETANEVRGLASRTDSNPPSLAETIPPPMTREADELQRKSSTPQQAAEELARPRLGLALEAARLARQNDRRTAVAYELLGNDVGEAIQKPDKLDAPTAKTLADRANALTGKKGEPARQAEIAAANERLAQLANQSPRNPASLASELETLSADASQAAGQAPKQQPLRDHLGKLAATAPPVADWAEATNPQEVAAGASQESLAGIETAPKQWESYNEASQILGDAARQIRMDNAIDQLAGLNPYPMPDSALASSQQELAASATAPQEGNFDGAVGKVRPQPIPKAMDQAEWARLNERLRQAIRSSGIENFSEEQQAAIRAYFEKLSQSQ